MQLNTTKQKYDNTGIVIIDNFFDENGIITFQTIEELDIILQNLSIDDYHNRLEAVEKNYEISTKFRKSVDDQIYSLIKRELRL